MYIEDFREIMTKIESDFRANEKYLNDLRLIDYSASEFVSENQYSNTYAIQCEYLQRMLFGEELYDSLQSLRRKLKNNKSYILNY